MRISEHTGRYEFLPPYGSKRKEFELFLERLPPGGLGFHATTTAAVESILARGIDLRYSENPYGSVYYHILDSSIDPAVRNLARSAGVVATYYRFKETLIGITFLYGGIKAAMGSRKEGVSQDTAVVVFCGATHVATRLREGDGRRVLGWLPEAEASRVPAENIIGVFAWDSVERIDRFAERVIWSLTRTLGGS